VARTPDAIRDEPDPLRQLRHAIRGTMNTIVLSTPTLVLRLPACDRLQAIDAIISSADSMMALMDRLEASP